VHRRGCGRQPSRQNFTYPKIRQQDISTGKTNTNSFLNNQKGYLHSISVITNSAGPWKTVRYNRDLVMKFMYSSR
jgi:hypothetical protein